MSCTIKSTRIHLDPSITFNLPTYYLHFLLFFRSVSQIKFETIEERYHDELFKSLYVLSNWKLSFALLQTQKISILFYFMSDIINHFCNDVQQLYFFLWAERISAKSTGKLLCLYLDISFVFVCFFFLCYSLLRCWFIFVICELMWLVLVNWTLWGDM